MRQKVFLRIFKLYGLGDRENLPTIHKIGVNPLELHRRGVLLIRVDVNVREPVEHRNLLDRAADRDADVDWREPGGVRVQHGACEPDVHQVDGLRAHCAPLRHPDAHWGHELVDQLRRVECVGSCNRHRDVLFLLRLRPQRRTTC